MLVYITRFFLVELYFYIDEQLYITRPRFIAYIAAYIYMIRL